MSDLLKEIEQEVLEEFTQKLNTGTNKDVDGAVSDLAIQMARISASITKAFIEKYEQEKKSL